MGSTLNEVSLSLDENLLQLMDQLEELEKKRGQLNSLIEEGWFSISKARYSMGNKQVSALQYASEMVPLVCVETKVSSSGEAEFQTQRKELKVRDVDKNVSTVEDIGPRVGDTMISDGVRRRGPKQQSEAKNEMVVEPLQEDTPNKVTDSSDHQDPLKWFGILVPQNLKQAQSAFKQVIDLAAEVAALQSAILASRAELQRLMKEKHSSATLAVTEE